MYIIMIDIVMWFLVGDFCAHKDKDLIPLMFCDQRQTVILNGFSPSLGKRTTPQVTVPVS